jgi:hypothetical protein
MPHLTSDRLAQTYVHASARHAAALADTLERVTQRAELAEIRRAQETAELYGLYVRMREEKDRLAGDLAMLRAMVEVRDTLAAKDAAEIEWLKRRARYLEDQANALDADNRRLRRARIHDGALIREAIAKLIADGKADIQPFEEGAADMLREDGDPARESVR